MTPSHVISELLKSDAKHLKNSQLLKKIIRAASLGRLQINGCSPDNKISFGNYLFDNERILFDFTRLSHAKKEAFKKWLLLDHEQEKEKNYFSDCSVNEYRGFTAEQRISWWGRIKKWAKREYTDKWKFKDFELSPNYQLLGMELCHGQQGILIGFKQWLVPPSKTKYKAEGDLQLEPMKNTKRVIFTDKIVDRLINTNFNNIDFAAVSKEPHPLAIDVPNPARRFIKMNEYRHEHNYCAPKPWYIRLWEWVLSWFNFGSVKQTQSDESDKKKADHPLEQLYPAEETSKEPLKSHGDLVIYKNGNQDILVQELSPDVENLVYCGGGSKIFAHIGVWKALNDKHIAPKKFAGTSAGAIMALMCYLGYSAEEIVELFKYLRQEHLVYFNFYTGGFSEAHAIKTAIDYAIAQKVDELVTRKGMSYPEGPITFKTLNDLRLKCGPDSGLGEELIVTATNIKSSTTRFFSLHEKADMEVSEAVMISASVPILFRATNLDGEDYNDGGVLNNFPTEAFHGDNTTFLESCYGNNLKTLAVQFDNGTERATVDRIKDRVHKEHFIFNWILGIMTGVNIPDGGWEKDRLKLRKYSAQSIIVNVDNISATNFSVDEDLQQKLITNGERAANNYIKPRYTDNHREFPKNVQLMHETFSSLEELLAYCCYVGNETRFNTVCDLINNSSEPNKMVLLKRADILKELYFSPLHQEEIKIDCSSNRIDEQLNARLLNQEQNQFNSSSAMIDDQLNIRPQSKNLINGHKAFIAIYPVILKLSAGLIKNKLEHFLLTKARHSFTKNSLFECLDYFNSIESELHIVFYIFIELIKVLQQELKKQSCIQSDVMVQSIYNAFKVLEKLLVSKTDVFKSNDLFGLWKIPLPQGISILNELATIDRGYAGLKGSCDLLRKKHQPVPIVTQTKSQDQDEKISFVSCL